VKMCLQRFLLLFGRRNSLIYQFVQSVHFSRKLFLSFCETTFLFDLAHFDLVWVLYLLHRYPIHTNFIFDSSKNSCGLGGFYYQ